MKDVQKIIDDFEAEYRARIVYITVSGSKLFGTDNANSDTDYKGIFIPSREDVLLKRISNTSTTIPIQKKKTTKKKGKSHLRM